jgi:acid stress-induced BolA-like protein IbaG/YrbA
VPIVPRGLVDQGKIKTGVQRAERALAPDVIRIMYSYGVDVVGEQSLFFRIVISDQAAAPARLRETTQRIIAKVMAEIKSQEVGLETYFNFRSRSEQAMLQDSSWERP